MHQNRNTVMSSHIGVSPKTRGEQKEKSSGSTWKFSGKSLISQSLESEHRGRKGSAPCFLAGLKENSLSDSSESISEWVEQEPLKRTRSWTKEDKEQKLVSISMPNVKRKSAMARSEDEFSTSPSRDQNSVKNKIKQAQLKNPPTGPFELTELDHSMIFGMLKELSPMLQKLVK